MKTKIDVVIYCDKETVNPLQECASIKRLISLLEIYSNLDIINNHKHQNILIQQINENEEYQHFLDDFIHLITDHSHRLELINESLLSRS